MLGRKTFASLVAAAVVAGLAMTPVAGAQNVTSTNYTGTTPDPGGGSSQWTADVPSPWNGTVLLYSHGFGGFPVVDSPDPTTGQALLNDGYALVGSSYDTSGSWWALDTAVSDQFNALSALEALLPSAPRHVFAFGTSMGGLISSLEAEHADGRLQGALTTCGIVAGGLNLNNYQLDGEYAMTQLINPTNESIRLVHFDPAFAGAGEALATGKQLDVLAYNAQNGGAAGRARLALAMSLMNVATWSPTETMPPAPTDYAGQEQEQYDVQFNDILPSQLVAGQIQTTQDFVEFGRPWIDQASGGSATWTKGVNFTRLLAESPYAPEVISLYRQAGLNLWADLAQLTRNANITADPNAVRSLEQTSVPTGRLQVPELDMHTISDQLVPVQQENYYHHTVQFAGRSELLRQTFVKRQLHCNFTPSELVAGVEAVGQRVETHHWGDLADPAVLNAAANATGLGTSAFIPYEPAPLSGQNGPFDPFTDGSFPFGFGRW